MADGITILKSFYLLKTIIMMVPINFVINYIFFRKLSKLKKPEAWLTITGMNE